MYPFVRMALTIMEARQAPPLPLDGTHISRHTAMPWDLDIFGEVNNGRILSLYDLNRFGLAARVGLIPVLRKNGWALTVAGSTIRYQRRLLAFRRYEMRARAIGRDDRFLYLTQSMWQGETALSHLLARTAVVSKEGIVPPTEVAAAMGAADWHPVLPPFAQAWIAAERERPWPPEDPPDR